MKITVAARDSNLSKAQVSELCYEMAKHFPDIEFVSTFLKSTGDKDLVSSLITMEKTDFFTKEIDQKVVNKECDIALHSAKDLPENLPDDLCTVAITKGVDSRDCLVMKKGQSLASLKEGAKIGTSSQRRLDMLKQMRSDFTPVSIRGTIEKRIQLLDEGKVDGVIIAYAALIRLGLENELNYEILNGETSPLQGKLAVTARKDNKQMQEIFSKIDAYSYQLIGG